MNAQIHTPNWLPRRANPEAHAASLLQLVNIAGPLGGGMAVALGLVLAAEAEEAAARSPQITAEQRTCLLELCHVSAQLLAEAALDGFDAASTMPGPN